MSYLEQRRKFIEEGRPLPAKKKYIIPKKSAKRIQKEKEQGIEIVKPKKAGWFNIELTETEDRVVAEINNEPNFKTAIQAKKEMDAFWKYAESVIDKKPYCWECGDFISKNDYRAATAHIFPKSIFESVASNKWNFLVLGARCGCHDKSHRLDTFSQMKVFPTAINRYMKFGELITEKHKYLSLFQDYANKITQ
jgi:hypothetical protein